MNRPMHASDVDQHSRVAVPFAPLDAQAMTVRCKIGAPIYTCGEHDRFWYRIVAGAVRQCVFNRRGNGEPSAHVLVRARRDPLCRASFSRRRAC